MAVTSVIESYEDISIATEVAVDGSQGTMTRFFDVTFNTAETAPLRAVLALSASAGGVTVPDWWEPLGAGVYQYWYVKRKTCRQHHGPFVWRVTVEYEYYDNPLYAPPKVTWGRVGSVEAIDSDKDGAAILNSSGEPFDPPLTREFKDRTLRIEKNLAYFNQEAYETYVDSVNQDIWSPFALNATGGNLKLFMPYTCKCVGIDGTPERVGNIYFHRVAYEFQIRVHNLEVPAGQGALAGPLGWRRRVLDQGFREISGDTYAQITDADGSPITQTARLNGSGVKLAHDAEDVYLIFADHDTQPFANLGL
jgi:hypothetical protein